MSVNDDSREIQMRQLFNLEKPADAGRSDVDAVLELETDGGTQLIQFELKSATKGKRSFSTVRDFGLHHLDKWRDKHWLFGVYKTEGRSVELDYCMYGSPAAMGPWYDDMEAYIRPDLALGLVLPDLLTDESLTQVLGAAPDFSSAEAHALMKSQLGKAAYLERSDARGRFSREEMLKMLQERAKYLIERGSTLNNRSIPASHFQGWPEIRHNHAARLRQMVIDALQGQPVVPEPAIDLSDRTDVLFGDD